MIVGVLNGIIFHADENVMTKAYYDKGKQFESGVNAKSSQDMYNEFQLAVGKDMVDIKNIIKEEVVHALEVRGFKPADFSFSFKTSEQIENGRTWLPSRPTPYIRILPGE